jgi:hypothetical protein
MNEQELRSLVREAIERHMGRPVEERTQADRPQHASHIILKVLPGSEGDGMCVIEPAVRCSHCGFCQSFGH